MSPSLLDLAGSRPAGDAQPCERRAGATNHPENPSGAFAEDLSREMSTEGRPGSATTARTPAQAVRTAASRRATQSPSRSSDGQARARCAGRIQPEREAPSPDSEAGSEAGAGASAVAAQEEQGTDTSASSKRLRAVRGPAKTSGASQPSSKGADRSSRKAGKNARASSGIPEPKVSPVSLAATQAATPLVKEPRTLERGRRSSPPERVPAATPARQDTAAQLPALAMTAPAPRPAAPTAALDPLARSGRTPVVDSTAVLPAEGAVLRHAAHLRIESPGAGEIALHLRVRGGVAYVRFDGADAPALRERAPELARELAREGLSLGQVDPPAPSPSTSTASSDHSAGTPAGWDTGGQGGGRQERDPDEVDAPAPRAQRTEPRTSSGTPSRVHVQA